MFARKIEASATISVSLLAHYTRERRSAEREHMASTNRSTQRLHGQSWQRLTDAMNAVTIKALRAGVDVETLSWLVQAASDQQLQTLICEDDNDNGHMVRVIEQMRTTAVAPVAPAAPAPKARKAPKAPVPVKAALVAKALEGLRTAISREGGHYHLKGLRVVELRATAKALKLGGCSGYRKAELIEHLIDFTIQARLDHAAILKAN